MPPKGKKKATARRQEPPRQPERRQEPPRQPERRQEPPRQPERRQEPPRQPERRQELPRQPERRQETADRFTLVLPPELSNLPPRQAPASQSETTIPPRQAPASQSGTNTQPRQAPASQSGATFQPPLPRQAPATLLSSQETIETVPSRLQSQQSAHLEVISSQESITSQVQNQLLLSQTPELFDEPIRGGDYDTSLNYRVEDEHQFGESSTAGMVRGAILEADARPTIPSASNRPERSTPRRERRQSSERASTERSITPYRRYVPYRNPNPLEFRGLADERSGEISPYQYRPRVREPSLPVDASNNEGKYNLLRKFSRYFLINFLLTFLAYLRGRIDELSRQLNNANDELRDLRTTFGQVTSYNELLVRENAELKRKLKGKGKGKGRARDDDDESEDEDAGDSRQIKRQRRVTHSSEEDEEVEDERARVSLNSY